jgi:signal transduction histidine kinase
MNKLRLLGFDLVVWMVVFAVGLSGVIVALSYGDYQQQREKAEGFARENLEAVLQGRVATLSNWIQERRSDGQQVFENPWVRDYLTNPDDAALAAKIAEWMGRMRRDYDYEALFFLNGNYDLLLESPAGAGSGFTHWPEHTRHLMAREVELSELHRTTDGLLHFSVMVPLGLSDRPGEPAAGMILLVLDPTHFMFPLLQEWPSYSETAETLLVRRQGDEVVYLNELRHQKNTASRLRLSIDDPNLPAALSFAVDDTSVHEGIDYRGVPVWAATAAVPGTPWHMVAKMDKSEIDQALSQALRGQRSQILLVLGIIWFGLLTILRGQRTAKLKADLEIQRTEQSVMREATVRLKMATEVAGLGIWEWNIASDKMVWNDRMFLIYGMEKTENHEVSYEAWREMVLPEDLAAREASIKAARATDQIEFRIQHPETGEIRHLISMQSILPRDDPYPPVMIGSTVDVTDRVRSQARIQALNQNLETRVQQRTQQLELANEELKSFSYSVSHDLRAPLRAIDGWAQVLVEDYGAVLKGEGETALNRLRAATQRMGTLIDDLLRLSRINHQDMQRHPVNMQALVAEVLDELEVAEPGAQKVVTVGPLPEAVGTATLLRQVWSNLIGNALKFTKAEEAPEIQVGSRLDSIGAPIYFVKDNGAGFDMQFVDKLFGAFKRLHSAREYPGTGIGLTLSQRIVRRHGGRIWAEAAVGIGAEFCFTLTPPAPESRIIESPNQPPNTHERQSNTASGRQS